jgi:hypothetical protein
MADETDSRAETRRRNQTLARRMQLGLVSAGIAGSVGFIAAAALSDDSSDPAVEVSVDDTVDTPSTTPDLELGSATGGASHATTQGS